MLVRTIHSVINTVHNRLLKEVIIVDDCSTNKVLKEKLDYYVREKLPKNVVKIIRLKHRLVESSSLNRDINFTSKIYISFRFILTLKLLPNNVQYSV